MRMKHVMLSLAVMFGSMVLTAVPVRAHHSFAAEFDANRPVKVQGTIVKVEWTNPHSWWHIDVRNANGEVERWQFESAAPGPLTRRGFTKDQIKPGTEVTVEGFMAKGTPRRANGRVMTFPDGRNLFMGSSGTGAPLDGTDPSESAPKK